MILPFIVALFIIGLILASKDQEIGYFLILLACGMFAGL